MDINQADEEKYLHIRQTIRRVILPLVQAIYDEDPADIISFCARYFEGQLQKRESTESNIEDGSVACPEAFTGKNGRRKWNQEANGSQNVGSISPLNIQGSSSEPLLSGEKRCDSLSLRETSSWEVYPPKLGRPQATQNCDLADVVAGIGDQPGSTARSSPDDFEIDAKSGDANSIVKEEEKIFQSCIPQENTLQGSNDNESIEEATILPSAPPYEENDRISQTITQCESKNFEDCTRKFVTHPESVALISKDKKQDTSSKSSVVCDSSSEDVKTSIKPLSPNSSFGFIPHLNEEDTKISPTELVGDLNDQEKSPKETQEVTLKYSETLNNLAEKLNLAENNLNVEFLKAKEISDIIQGRCHNERRIEDANLVLDSMNNDSTFARTVDETINEDNVNLVSDNNNNILTKTACGQNCKAEYLESTDETRETQYVTEDRNLINKMNIQNSVLQDSELCESQRNVKDIDHHQNDFDSDESRMNNLGHRPVVDETWIKRWYEVHPCLDNTGRSFQQTVPRLLRTKRTFTGNRRNLNAHNIGEAGDVPSGGYHHIPDGITRSDSSAFTLNRASEIHPQPKELRKEKNVSNVTKVTSDVPQRSSMESDSNMLSDKSVPGSWRRTNETIDYSETKKNALKQLLEIVGEQNRNSEDRSVNDSSEDKTSHEREILSEIVVVKESDKCIKDDIAKHEQSLSSNKKASYEDKDNFGNSSKNAGEKTKLSPLKISSVCETNVEKMISDCNDQDLNKEEEYIDVVEAQENFSHESRETTSSDKYDSRDSSDENVAKSCFPDEKNKMLAQRKTETSEIDEGIEITVDSKESSPVIKPSVSENKINEDHLKIEPGLHSACGDFTSSDNNVSKKEELNKRQNSQNGFNSYLKSSQHNNISDDEIQVITPEYVGETIETVLQEQNTSDSFEGLNFSSFSDSGSSNIESDYSEAEDTLNNGVEEL